MVLQKLNLLGCSKLKELPTSINQLIILQKLNLSGCSKLKELPTSIELIDGFTRIQFVSVF
jgi:hypothetical protein